MRRKIIGVTVGTPRNPEKPTKLANRIEGRAITNSKYLANLEKSLMTEVADGTVAYRKTVPSDALPYAKIRKVGGMTRKCTNLFGGEALADKLVSVASGTKDETAGTVYVSGAAIAGKVVLENVFKENTPYTIILKCHSSATGYVSINVTYTDGTVENITGLDAGVTETLVKVTNANKTVKNLIGTHRTNDTFYYNECGVFEGVLTASDFEPYFAGFHHAAVTGLKTTGKNIFGGEALADKIAEVIPSATKNEESKSIYFTAASASNAVFYTDFKDNTQYTFVFKIKRSGVGKTSLMVRYTDGTFVVPTNNVGDTIETITFTSAAGKTIDYFGGGNYSNMTIYYDGSGIFEGVLTAEDFEPYVERPFPIPAEVQALEGYGWGSTEVVHNYVDWENKQFVKNMGCVDLGTLSWTRIASVGRWVASVPNLRNSHAYFVCENYSPHRFEGMGENCIAITADVKVTVKIADDTVKPTGLLYYGLATPEIIDISDILPADNLIEVEGGGTITFENEHGLAVPSEVAYPNTVVSQGGGGGVSVEDVEQMIADAITTTLNTEV